MNVNKTKDQEKWLLDQEIWSLNKTIDQGIGRYLRCLSKCLLQQDLGECPRSDFVSDEALYGFLTIRGIKDQQNKKVNHLVVRRLLHRVDSLKITNSIA